MISDLSKKQQAILFIHLTLGQMFLYPRGYAVIADLLNMQTWLSTVYINLLFYSLILSSSLILAKDLYLKSWQTFKSNIKENIFLAFKLLPLLYLSSMVFNGLAIYLSGQDIAGNQALLNEMYQTSPLFIIVAATIYAPIMEELLFRGFFFGLFKDKNVYLALFISGLTFGFAHMYTPEMSLLDFAFLPSYSVLGMIIAYSYHKSQNIYTPVLLHFLNNFIGIVLMSLV